MKLITLLTGVVLGLYFTAQAGIYTYSSGTINQAIPDGNTAGWSSTFTFTGIESSVQSVAVTIDLSGGHNGDLYAYLSYDGLLVPFLNRVGVGTGNSFGYLTSGMNVTLSDSGSVNIHNVLNPTAGAIYQADGRAITPLSSASAFDTAPTISFANFAGKNPNGTWTIFFSDVSSDTDGAKSTLVNWQVDISAVPEPANVALGVFAAIFLLTALLRQGVKRRALPKASF